MLDLGDADSPYTKASPTVLRKATNLSSTLFENGDSLSKPSQVQSMIDIKQWRPKRIRQGR